MKILVLDRPVIMGILNVTPDSFSDGGRFLSVEKAVQQAGIMLEQGADIIDIGGESTRPGSERIIASEQKNRVIPVIEAISQILPPGKLISIDTTLSEVAALALSAGASIINDISAGRDDPEIMSLASEYNCPYIIMHMKGTPATMQTDPVYENVLEEILNFLLERAQICMDAGIKSKNIIIDPGIGFGKTMEHNLELMAHLDRFVGTGYPVLLGASRKRFIGSICSSTSPDQLVGATCATTVLGVAAGIKLFRVHDIRENRQAADVAWNILYQ